MNPRDALHQQELLREACHRPSMQRYLGLVVKDINAKRNGPAIVDGKGEITGEVVGLSLAQLLEAAETFYVSEDMAAVAEAASHGLDGLDRFTHDMWPSDWGFMYFEKGYLVTDVWGRPVVTSALAWQRRPYKGMPGTIVWSFTMLGDERDALTQSLTEQEQTDMAVEQGSRLELHATNWIIDGQRVGPDTVPTPEKYYGSERLETDEELQELQEYLETSDPLAGTPAALSHKPMPTSQNPTRIILALLMLMEQKIARKESTNLRPRNPKRARRMKVPGQVTIIRLRHEMSQREPGETQVEWQHRWFVRGHWRWQHVGPHHPLAVEFAPGDYRARIYIAPFIKGPDGLPIKQSKKINALIR